MNYWNVIISFIFLAISNYGFAQELPKESVPRSSDQFWRKKVLSRIDLNEKQNKYFTYRTPLYLYPQSIKFDFREGLVNALITALKSNQVLAYNPDTLDNPINFSFFINKTYKKDKSSFVEPTASDDSTGLKQSDDSDFDEEWEEDSEVSEEEEENNAVSNSIPTNYDIQTVSIPFNYIVEVLEDRIFDKNKSDTYYKIEFIRLVWVDPLGAVPEECIASFRFNDIAYILERTQATNRQNDAEDRTMLEAFKNRNFNSFDISVSGIDPQSLREAEKLRRAMIEFEHHLWEF